MTQSANPLPAKQAAAKAYCAFNLASFTVGTEAADTINVAVVLKDARGQAVSGVKHVRVYLADLATGVDITATAPTSTLAIGTNGKIQAVEVTDKVLSILTNASGQFDLNVIQTAALTYYMILEMPDGSIYASGAITFV